MYEGDSFYTLTWIGRVGLVMLSVAMTLLLLWLAWALMKRMPLPFGILLALVLFFGFVWLSPQIYYTYYMTLFEGLPWQIVVKSPPSANTLFKLLTFRGPANLSAHSQGVLGWLLLVMSLWARKGCLGKSTMR